MKLKDYNTTAKMYELFLQFKEGQFNNSINGIRYLNKFFNKAKLEPTIISSYKIVKISDNCWDGQHYQDVNIITLKDSIFNQCESDEFNGWKFSAIKSSIIHYVLCATNIPRDLINFNIIMQPRFDSNGNNEITEDTIYNNKDYVLTVNITTPLNDLMRFSLFFYQKWMDIIESKRLMQEGYKKTLEKYKSTEINKELLDKNKLLNQQLSNNRQEIKELNDLINAQKIDLTMRDRFIQKLEDKQEKEVNLEFDELISKKDNEIKRLNKENEDFLNLINERDSIIKKQSEQENNNDKFASYQNKIKELVNQIEYQDKRIKEYQGKNADLTANKKFLDDLTDKLQAKNKELNNKNYLLEDANMQLNNLLDKKEWINNNLKNLTEQLDSKVKELFELQFLYNLQHETLNDFTSKYLEMKKISEDLAIQNNELYLKNKYNENLMIAYSNACKEITNTFEFIYNYQMISDIINKHIENIKE